MSTRVKIHGCDVDFTQQSIVRNGEVFKLQLKVLQVLMCLMDKQGELVSIDELMTTVWPDSIVSNNALQRCIAKLRQAFGDSGQSAAVIKTYPKRGYALIAEIVLLETDATNYEARHHEIKSHEVKNQTQFSISKPQSIAKPVSIWNNKTMLIVSLLLVCVIGVTLQFSSAPSPLRTTQLDAIMTASSAHTGNPKYSPDGSHLLFKRYESFCQSDIWLQNVSNKQEIRLSAEKKTINDATWSPDGKSLLIAEGNRCIVPAHEICWQLKQIKLNDDMQNTGYQPIGSCEHQEILALKWQSQHQALFIQRQDISPNGSKNHRYLRQININTGLVTTLFDQGDVLTFTPTANGNVAVISHYGSGKLRLFEIDKKGEILHQVDLNYSDQTSIFMFSHLTYSQKHQQLLLESNGQLFELHKNGTLVHYIRPDMGFSEFDLSPSEEFVIARRGYDQQDLVFKSANRLLATPQEKDNASVSSFMSSKAAEDLLRFSPKNNQLAFISNRSGSFQIWLSDSIESPPRQLTQFQNTPTFSGLEWLQSGDALVTVVNDKLVKISITGQTQTIPFSIKIKSLHQSLPDAQLLIEYQHDYQESLAVLDLQTLNFKDLLTGQFIGAQLDVQQTLWFIDDDFRLNHLTASKTIKHPMDFPINSLRIIDGELVTSSKKHELLAIGHDGTYRKLMKTPDNSYLTDGADDGFAFVQRQPRNSDIVQLKVSH